MDLREIIVGGLLLPLKIYLQPDRFIDEVAGLAPDLPRNYSLWQARHKLHDVKFRQSLMTLIIQSCLVFVWGTFLTALISVFSNSNNWSKAASVFQISVLFYVTLLVTSSVVGSVAFSVWYNIVMYVLLVVFSIPFEELLFLGLFPSFVLQANAMLGARRGIGKFLWDGIVAGSIYGGVLAVIVGGEAALEVGLEKDLVAGVWTFVFAVVVLPLIGIAAFVIIELLINCHILIYPFEFCISALSWVVGRLAPGPLLQRLWRLSPVRWDEIIIPPLPGLSQLLIDLSRYDSVLGSDAIDEVSRHYYQKKAAFKALGELAYENARQLDTLPAIASYERGLDWLNSETILPDNDKSPLLMLKEISQMIDAAIQSDTPRNKISQLRLALEKAQTLRRNPGRFGPVISKWQQIITDGLVKAEEERRTLEPIRQVYFNDGAPISPDELIEDESPFKGRMDTVRELEGALGDSKRSTLLLTGNRRSGKSSLLLQLPRKLGPQVLPAFIDCQSAGIASSESAGGMLIGLVEAIVEQARRNVDKFRRDPVKFPRIDQEAFERDPYPALSRWLDGTERALGGRKLLLCLDEFEKLEDALAAGRVDERFLSMLRNIIQHHSRIIVLLSGSHHLDELPPRWADALVSTQSLKISFLEEADARDLVIRPVKGFPDIYQPDAVEHILRLTHSQPYLVQLLCGLLVEKMNRERREPPSSFVAVADVEAVIELALDRGEAYFNDLWRSQTGGNLARRVLEKMAFADGESATSVAIRELTDDDQAIRATTRTLLRREIIEQTPDGYHITVPLVGCYVRSQCRPV